MIKYTFTSKEVIKLIGITYRQLDYWDRSEFIKPSMAEASGYGTKRLYSFVDLVKLKVAKRLKEMNVSLQKIRLALDYLGSHFPSLESPLHEMHFLTDNKDIFVVTSDPNVVINVLKHGQFAWNFNIGQIAEEIENTADKFTDTETMLGVG